MHRSHIIRRNYPETGTLIQELQQNELDKITVIDDEEMKNGLKRLGNIVYASKEYVEDARLSHVTEFNYYYIAPFRRKSGDAWKVKKGDGLLHEYLADKKRWNESGIL